MNLAARARRDAVAQEKIVGFCERITDMLDLPPSFAEGLMPQQRDGLVRAMLQREALAVFLEATVEALERGKPQRGPGRPRKES
jgi:hypothetical protein